MTYAHLLLFASLGQAPDLKDYKTVETAKTTTLRKQATKGPGQSGYLGVSVSIVGGKLTVDAVVEGSPGAIAGLLAGDQLLQLAGESVVETAAFRDAILSRSPGEKLAILVRRGDKTVDLTATLGTVSKPLDLNARRAVIGIQTGDADDGILVKGVTPGLPAERAGIKSGDVILKINGQVVSDPGALTNLLASHAPGDLITLFYRRDGKEHDIKITLAADATAPPVGSWDNRNLTPFKKNLYKLAVIGIEYPDVAHNPKISGKDWESSFFSKGSYNTVNATGQKTFGSLLDYYLEQSFNHLNVEGKMFDFVKVSKKRLEYGQGTSPLAKSQLLSEALDLVLARDGKDCLKGYDGVMFIYAGTRATTVRGNLYWPHRASFKHQGRSWPYFICPEGADRMTNISVFCHEFGHLLGLPDLYARPENPGSEGVGVWCAMSNQVGNGRPQHFSAWSKEQLGWIQPAIIDPTVKQKLILAPIEDSPKECYKVLVRPDGSEYYLLENRRKKGFDQELPAEGLLIWRVVANRPILEEAHGIDGPSGPRVHLAGVPFPSPANQAFTPYTTPSSRSQLGGGLPVYITNIRKLPDGRISFLIGYEFY